MAALAFGQERRDDGFQIIRGGGIEQRRPQLGEPLGEVITGPPGFPLANRLPLPFALLVTVDRSLVSIRVGTEDAPESFRHSCSLSLPIFWYPKQDDLIINMRGILLHGSAVATVQ